MISKKEAFVSRSFAVILFVVKNRVQREIEKRRVKRKNKTSKPNLTADF
tara:strand:- start:171 stop:317 length:147 start_codon:yes stop_codon:yes gene_type:complete